MKFDIYRETMSQSSYFKSRPDLVEFEGVGGGNQKSWKTLRVERSGCNLVGRIRKCRRYVIYVTGLDPLSLEIQGRVVQCFGEFGASRRARMIKTGRCVRDLHKWT